MRQANVQPGDRILDVGCGTGTLAVLLKQAVPEAHVVGLDADRRGLVPVLQDAGFGSVVETHREMTLFGTLSLYRALLPNSHSSQGG